MKILKILIPLIFLSASVSFANDTPIISGRVGPHYYHIGGGKVLPPPTTRMSTYRITARFKGSISYSCGNFDMNENVKQMFDQLGSQIRGLPSQIMSSFQSAVMSLPAYIMKKASPSLYGLLNTNKNEFMDIFKMSYKTCQQLEREIRDSNDKSFNPYGDFMRFAVAEQWQDKAENSPNDTPIDEFEKQAVEDAKKDGFKWLNGERYGGEGQKSVDINTDIVLAGYNYLIGRDKANDETAPTGNAADHQIVKIWNTPIKAANWLGKVVGKTEIRLDDPTPKSEPGVGFRPEIEELTEDIRSAIAEAVNNNDYTEIRNFRTVQVTTTLVYTLKQMAPGEQNITIDKLASELAISEVQNKVILMKQILRSGLMNPDVNASKAGGIAHEYVRNKTLPTLEEQLADVHKDILLKINTFNRTALKAIDYVERKQGQNATKQPILKGDKYPLINGRIKKP